MKAIWNDSRVIAEAPKEELIYIEGNWYFPPHAVERSMLRQSPTPYVCPWKGVCQYYDVGNGTTWSKDSAWSYPEPEPRALQTIQKDFSGYVAFWRDVRVEE